MSLRVTIAGQPITVDPKTSIPLEFFNPLFDTEVVRGSYSYSFDVLLDAPTRRVFGYPDLIESVQDLRRRFTECDIEDQGYAVAQGGELLIQRFRPGKLTVMVSFGLSRLVQALERPLSSFQLGGERTVPPAVIAGDYTAPGLVQYANAVMAAPQASDFLFAPLLNYYAEAEPLTEPVPLNQWIVFPEPLIGLPAGGSFSYTLPTTVPGQLGSSIWPRFVPLVKLRYLLSAVLQELGIPVRLPALEGELGELVLLSGNQIDMQFRLSDVVPATPLRDVLNGLKQGLGLVLLPGPRGEMHLEQVQELLARPAYEDWTHLAAPDYEEGEIPEVQGMTLVYEPAADDEQAAGFYQVPDVLPVGPAVATPADLPRPTVLDVNNPPRAERRLVQSLRAYYASTVKTDLTKGTVEVSWQRSGSLYGPVPLRGGGSEQGQGFSATALSVLPSQFYLADREDALVPGITERSYVPGEAEEKRSKNFRLAFYRGLQPYAIDPSHPLASLPPRYPLVTPFNVNARGERVGDYSLQLDGPDGTASRLVGKWHELLATGTPVKRRFYLSASHLARLQFGQKVRVQGNLYLVKQVSVTVPVQKAATVTLIPLRRG